MEGAVVAGVELRVESAQPNPPEPGAAIELRLLGPMTIRRDGVVLALPASRKLRALLAYLALAPRAQTRTHLCELLGDIPSDPRGELRWYLSKLRAALDTPAQRRVKTAGDTVAIDLRDGFVDVLDIEQAMQEGIAKLGAAKLRALADLVVGDLEGLELDRSPHFNGWLVAQRRRLRACHVAIVEHWAGTLAADSADVLPALEKWLQMAPFDRQAHKTLLSTLGRRGQWREGEEHLAATAKVFEAEGLDWRPIRDAWRAAGAQRAAAAQVLPAAARVPPAAAPVASELAIAHAVPVVATDLSVAGSRRASIAVMPFTDQLPGSAAWGGLAGGLAHDIITRLSKLRSLFVIAQGTVFALHQRSIGAEAAGRALSVDYVVSGSLRLKGKRIAVDVVLAETRTARIVWAETFEQRLGDTFAVLDEIGNRIVASVSLEIELSERNRAVLKPPSSLDAWEAHHRGLWHMYRFNRADNQQARHFFEMAVRLDPTFSRAHAGLSFTHFQNAFLGWGERDPSTNLAFASADQGLVADDRDPTAHWALGRALWLRGRHDQSVAELETAVNLSPNFAAGHYTLAFVHSQSGDPDTAITCSDHSRHLSPYDPLLFGMLASRALALVRLGRLAEAADWAVRAAARPNAHAHVRAITALCLALADRVDEAAAHTRLIHEALPLYRVADLFAAFRFGSRRRPSGCSGKGPGGLRSSEGGSFPRLLRSRTDPARATGNPRVRTACGGGTSTIEPLSSHRTENCVLPGKLLVPPVDWENSNSELRRKHDVRAKRQKVLCERQQVLIENHNRNMKLSAV